MDTAIAPSTDRTQGLCDTCRVCLTYGCAWRGIVALLPSRDIDMFRGCTRCTNYLEA
jgi:hypothetical protein